MVFVSGCGGWSRREESRQPPRAAQVVGSLEVPALAAPVRVVRDRWGVPHIYASSAHDLFVAQGFVQAQDRLFQMDLWRRSAQGRLAEVLGANFIERDAMTRRVQYRGDLDAEWASYGPDARAIAEAFVTGVNAWVATVRGRPPEEFLLAGWTPELWTATDLLNRTDAFVDSTGAREEVERRGLNDIVADAIRRAGASPFFTGLAAKLPPSPAQDRPAAPNSADRELLAASASVTVSPSLADVRDGRVEVAESPRRLADPSARYLVHLNAPGWNVIGATAPWRPGVAVGHNDRLAWGAGPADVETWRVRVDATDASASRVIKDAIVVKGRAVPFQFETELTPRGVVVATDRAAGKRFVLEWTGLETGAAPEMASLMMDRADTIDQFREAAARWKLPARQFAYGDAEGRAGGIGRVRQEGQVGRAVSERAIFEHPLAITGPARARFNVGPLNRPSRDDQPVRLVLNLRSWDDSRAINAPGQSESHGSEHFSDLATLWSAGQMFPLVFSKPAIDANASATLALVPASRR